jgi:hypothetical protein
MRKYLYLFLINTLGNIHTIWSSDDLWLKGEFDEQGCAYIDTIVKKALEKMHDSPERHEVNVRKPEDYHMTVYIEDLQEAKPLTDFFTLKKPSSNDFSNFYKGIENLKRKLDNIRFEVDQVHIPHSSTHRLTLYISFRAVCTAGNGEDECFTYSEDMYRHHVTIATGIATLDNIRQDPTAKYMHGLKSQLFEVLKGRKNKLLKGNLCPQNKEFIEELQRDSLNRLDNPTKVERPATVYVLETKEYKISAHECLSRLNKSSLNFRPQTLSEKFQSSLKQEVEQIISHIPTQKYKIEAVKIFKDREGNSHLVLALERYISKNKKKKPTIRIIETETIYDPWPFIEIARSTKKCKEAADYFRQWQVKLEEAMNPYPIQPLQLSYLSAYRKGGKDPLHVAE